MKKTFHRAVFVVLLSLLLASCATAPVARISEQELGANLSGTPAALREDYRRLLSEDKNNDCLNQMRLGLKAYKLGYKDVAKSSFDKVLLNIESFYTDTEAAKKARSLWYEEGMKDFKGEPYERVMAYYYRGLIFLEDGDYENARAAFKSAVLQDAFAEEEQYRADFALVIFLEGLASRFAGDTEAARGVFDELKKFRPDFTPQESFNVIVIAESGTSPRKVADGPGHADLVESPAEKSRERRGKWHFAAGGKADGNPHEVLFRDETFREPTRKFLEEFLGVGRVLGVAVHGHHALIDTTNADQRIAVSLAGGDHVAHVIGGCRISRWCSICRRGKWIRRGDGETRG